jgi:threonine synthase
MLAGQAEGAAPLLTGRPVANPQTVATAIRIGNPARLEEAMAAVRESDGAVRAMPDDRILSAYRMLAQEEGVFCEPASATSVAALIEAVADGLVAPGSTVVCVLTGHGLKDPDIAGAEGAEIVRCPPYVESLEELALGAEPVRA